MGEERLGVTASDEGGMVVFVRRGYVSSDLHEGTRSRLYLCTF